MMVDFVIKIRNLKNLRRIWFLFFFESCENTLSVSVNPRRVTAQFYTRNEFNYSKHPESQRDNSSSVAIIVINLKRYILETSSEFHRISAEIWKGHFAFNGNKRRRESSAHSRVLHTKPNTRIKNTTAVGHKRLFNVDYKLFSGQK